jgi:hypothetical protein
MQLTASIWPGRLRIGVSCLTLGRILTSRAREGVMGDILSGKGHLRHDCDSDYPKGFQETAATPGARCLKSQVRPTSWLHSSHKVNALLAVT